MVQVANSPGISFEKVLKKLKRKCEAEGIFEEMRSRRFFLTESQKRRLKHKRAVQRLKKEANENGRP